jgi:hypothetical protein
MVSLLIPENKSKKRFQIGVAYGSGFVGIQVHKTMLYQLAHEHVLEDNKQ